MGYFVKIYLIVFATILFPCFGFSGGIVCFQVEYTPANPTVGELITFTVKHICPAATQGPEGGKNNPQSLVAYMPCYDPANDGSTTVLFPEGDPGVEVHTSDMKGPGGQLPDPATFSHTYSAPGVYNIGFACAVPVPVPPSTSDNKKNSYAKARAATVNLGQIRVGARVPTLSQWGLIILAISLITLGFVALRQSKSPEENINLSK